MINTNQEPGLLKSEVVLPKSVRSTEYGQEQERKWSVLLLYPEYLQKMYEKSATIFLWVTGDDIDAAIWKAQLEALDAQLLPVLDPKDFAPLFVAKGHVENEMGQ